MQIGTHRGTRACDACMFHSHFPSIPRKAGTDVYGIEKHLSGHAGNTLRKRCLVPVVRLIRIWSSEGYLSAINQPDVVRFTCYNLEVNWKGAVIEDYA